MRTEIAGAQITSAVVAVIEALQTYPEIRDRYLGVIDYLTRYIITNCDTVAESDQAMECLKTLQEIRGDIATLATPPDLDDPENDIPATQI